MPTKTLSAPDPSDFAVALTTGAGSSSANLWAPNATISYKFDANVSATDRSGFRQAIEQWHEVTGLRFLETTGNTNVTISFADLPPGIAGRANLGPTPGGFVRIDTDYVGQVTPGNYAFLAAMHELGHTIGLTHTGPYNGTTASPSDAVYYEDALPFSIMSYWDTSVYYLREIPHSESNGPSGTDSFFFFSSDIRTPMPWDIATTKHYYNEIVNVRTGNDTYFFNSSLTGSVYDLDVTERFVGTIRDGGGYDTLDLSLTSYNQIVDLRTQSSAMFAESGGRYSSVLGYTGNLFIPTETVIEKVLSGSGFDYLYARSDVAAYLDGGEGTDYLYGSNLNDSLYGVDGSIDYLFGLAGQDYYEVGGGDYVEDILTFDDSIVIVRDDAGGLTTFLSLGFGNDHVVHEGSGTAVIDSSDGADFLIATGLGSIQAKGGSGVDVITGADGNDIIDGGFGADILAGGFGDDRFYVDDRGDKVTEATGGGADSVASTVTFSLKGGSVEGITLTGSAGVGAVGNELNNKMTGNTANNKLVAGSGNDALYGGLGKDALYGELGNDSFVFNTALGSANVDAIYDFANASGNNDTIRLENAIFKGLTAVGTLVAGLFAANTTGTAIDVDDRVVYETDTGKLFYDSNGSRSGGSVQFAMLTEHPILTYSDFYVI
jgi:serralysin